ncbi:hypothetical protein [Peribacillus glennii]|uniref:hypothetical protein n=1 Tax=Peribacillus glennii TaxID=2303991 RepID=UPI00115CF034|nr:hypothetical protein [Peribacillus glennii]
MKLFVSLIGCNGTDDNENARGNDNQQSTVSNKRNEQGARIQQDDCKEEFYQSEKGNFWVDFMMIK